MNANFGACKSDTAVKKKKKKSGSGFGIGQWRKVGRPTTSMIEKPGLPTDHL